MSNFVDKSGLIIILNKIKSWVEGKGYITLADIPEGAAASSTSPKMDGTATVGTETTFARGDHIHPTDTSRAASSHAHGNVTNGGAITATGVAIASGDAIAIVDSSNSSKLAKTSITFDGSTTSKALTQKGTWGSFLTSHQSLSNYYTKSDTDTAISTAIGGITQFDTEVVTTLPTTGVKGKIYFMAHTHGTGDAYDEYIWTGSAFEKIGNTDVNLTDYVTKTDQSVILLTFISVGSNGYKFRIYGTTTDLLFDELKVIFNNHIVAIYNYDGDDEFVISGYNYTTTNSCFICTVGGLNGDTYNSWSEFKSDGTYSVTIKKLQEVINASNKLAASNVSGLATVATSGSYNDLSNKPSIPDAVTETTVSGWGFTKNTGTYSKPSTGIPKTDLASAVQTSLGKADTALQSVPDASTTVKGITTVGASGGAAAYSHSHSYTNDSALSADDIKSAFVTAQMFTASTYPA